MEKEPFLIDKSSSPSVAAQIPSPQHQRDSSLTRTRLVAAVCIAGYFLTCHLFNLPSLAWPLSHPKPLTASSAHSLALRILDKTPLIDGHVDLPIYLRYVYKLQLQDADLSKRNITPDVDLPRLKAGRSGGMFFSCYVPCASDLHYNESSDFLTASWRVRDTLEQIDLSRQIMQRYSDQFSFADSSKDIRKAHMHRKLAGLMGIEGAHQLGNSLSVLRQYRELGVRYVTLTHACHNAFADSCGYDDQQLPPLHNGLSTFGKTLIKEMNRIGMLVDLSHTSDETANQALSLSLAPVIWSHSNARNVYDSRRNVPDSILERIARAENGDRTENGVRAGDALIMANFVPYFLAKNISKADIRDVINQIDHLGKVAGRRHVGLGSDFDGIGPVNRVRGLEDVSKYPDLLAELLLRGWSKKDVEGLISGNLMRVMDKVDAVAAKIQITQEPHLDVYPLRKDLDIEDP